MLQGQPFFAQQSNFAFQLVRSNHVRLLLILFVLLPFFFLLVVRCAGGGEGYDCSEPTDMRNLFCWAKKGCPCSIWTYISRPTSICYTCGTFSRGQRPYATMVKWLCLVVCFQPRSLGFPPLIISLFVSHYFRLVSYS
jgi:hypothetical protein